MSDLKNRLGALLKNQNIMLGGEWQRQTEDLAKRRAAGDFEIARVVPGEVVGGEEDGFYRVRTDIPLDTAHGGLPLRAVFDVLPEHIGVAAVDTELEAFDPRAAVFIDTETTGLSGGTGTVPFLVGAAYIEGDAVRLDQCFMRDYDDEEPMLDYLGELFARFETVVTYNGKAFDLPLMRTRFIQHRKPFRLDAALHLDLVHAARRFWKVRLRDCSLTNIERRVLNIHRTHDIPGAEIPQLWLDYVRSRDARRLDRVFYHHRMDILSLVALTAAVSRSLAAAGDTGLEHAEDQLSVVRLYFRQKRYDDVVAHARCVLETEAGAPLRRECIGLLANACRRLEDFDAMEDAWLLMLQEFPSDFDARLELAKHHEHRTRNLEEAERICAETVQILETRIALDREFMPDRPTLEKFRHRLERIRRKRARALPRESGPDETISDDLLS